MTEVQLVESLQRQRDEWVAKHKECTQLLGEALQDTTNVSIERDALKDAALLALDALDHVQWKNWRTDKAINALKAVL